MPVVSPRIVERAREDFGATAPRIVSTLEKLELAGQVDAERVQAAIILVARGDRSLFDDALDHARSDWRDLLDRAGLATSEWRARLDDELGRE